MRRRFIVVDNKPAGLLEVKYCLSRLSYQAEDVWPGENTETLRDWEAVWNRLAELTELWCDPGSEEVFVLFDLALDPSNQMAREGCSQLLERAHLFSACAKVAVTLWPLPARKLMQECPAALDAVVDRGALSGEMGWAVLKRAVEDASAHRRARLGGAGSDTAIPEATGVLIHDSPGARAMLAALGVGGLHSLTAQVAGSWQQVAVSTLTGGFSGAFVLKIDGCERAAKRSTVCKVARSFDQLKDELTRMQQVLRSSEGVGPFLAHAIESVPKAVPGIDGYYFIQLATEDGCTLEELFRRRPSMEGQVPQEEGQSIQRQVQAFLFGARRVGERIEAPSKLLVVKDDDSSRFLRTVSRLEGLEAELVSRHMWSPPTGDGRVGLRRVADPGGWAEFVSSVCPTVRCWYQHGDLNVRNVIVARDGRLRVIDWARYQEWPGFYDLCRLELQTFLRALQSTGASEFFPEELQGWYDRWEKIRDGGSGETASGAGEPALAFSELRRNCATEWGVAESEMWRVTRLMWLFDAMKICSYQDAGPFIQLLFLWVCDDCTAALLRGA